MNEKINWHEWFYYDETSPSCLRWKVDVKSGRNYCTAKIKAGDPVGSVNSLKMSTRHWRTKLAKRSFLVHRIVWELHNGTIEEGVILDHINGDGLDNRIVKLRLATKQINAQNQRLRKTNTSGTSGVILREDIEKGDRWIATWYNITGKMSSKSFSVTKYGYDTAKSMAINVRKKAGESLNEAGENYTERHGK